MCVSVIPGCHSSCVMSCAISNVQGSLGCCVKHASMKFERNYSALSTHSFYQVLRKHFLSLSAQDSGLRPFTPTESSPNRWTSPTISCWSWTGVRTQKVRGWRSGPAQLGFRLMATYERTIPLSSLLQPRHHPPYQRWMIRLHSPKSLADQDLPAWHPIRFKVWSGHC